MIPKAAFALLPLLWAEIAANWPTVPTRSAIPAQIEQETCPSLTSRQCWNPRAELKTSREYGFGLGQITVTDRFNTFNEVRQAHRQALAAWNWDDRYDPRFQMRALVLMDRGLFTRFGFAADARERMAFTFAGYNGGAGGVLKDREVCRYTTGCDVGRWWGHVERTSTKSRAKWQGYGQSAFDINRTYVTNIMTVRRAKYAQLIGER